MTFWVLLVCPPDDDAGDDWRADPTLAKLQPVVIPARGVNARRPLLFRYMPSPAFFDWLAREATYDPVTGAYGSDAPT